MATITKVDFVNKRILTTKPISVEPVAEAYKRIAGIVGKPNRILEAVGEPMNVNVNSFFPRAERITRWAYSHEGSPELVRKYLSMIPANSDYDLVIANQLIEAWADVPFVLIHEWAAMLLRCLHSAACIMTKECPEQLSVYARVTMDLSFKKIVEFEQDDLVVIVGCDLR